MSNGDRVMPDPILVGRNKDKLSALAKANGVNRITTDLDAALADPNDTVFFDAATTQMRPALLGKAIEAGKHIYTEKPVATNLEDVAGDLEAGELVVGEVTVEGVDDPVAIAPGIRPELVELEPVALAVAGEVEPEPRPADAVAGRCEEPVDQVLVSVGPNVGQERRDLLGGRGQSGQVEGETADRAYGGRPGAGSRGRRPRGAGARTRRSGATPGVLVRGWRRATHRLERPPVTPGAAAVDVRSGSIGSVPSVPLPRPTP